MTPKLDMVLEMCIDTGIKLGYERAHKHTDTPTKQQMVDAISAAIWNEIYEWFDNVHKEVE